MQQQQQQHCDSCPDMHVVTMTSLCFPPPPFLLCGGVVLVLLLTLPPPGLCPCVTVTNSHCRELQEQIRVMEQNLKCLSVAEEKVLTFPFLNH